MAPQPQDNRRGQSKTPSGPSGTSRSSSSSGAGRHHPNPPWPHPLANEVLWLSDNTFQIISAQSAATISEYTFVTLTSTHTPENISRVGRLYLFYSWRYEALRRSSAQNTAVPVAHLRDCETVTQHLAYLYSLRRQRDLFLRTVRGILEPLEARTFLFRKIGGDWVEISRLTAGETVERALRRGCKFVRAVGFGRILLKDVEALSEDFWESWM